MFSSLAKNHELFDLIICNPPSLPMPAPAVGGAAPASSFYYAGPNGRDFIEALLREAKSHLTLKGRVWLVHTSLANLAKTIRESTRDGIHHLGILAQAEIPIRDFYDMKWIRGRIVESGDETGLFNGLYREDQGGLLYETLYLLECRYGGAESARSLDLEHGRPL